VAGPHDNEAPNRAGRSFDLAALAENETAGGLVLLAATLAAMLWSNLSGSYHATMTAPLLGLTPELWVNDGLMTLFFLAVGLEMRWELTEGALGSVRLAAAPGLAALGGMLVPALVYVAVIRGDPAALHGWAVPVATDIAFAMAAASALGSRVPAGLKTFLTALAIIDDLLAILVIALFYSSSLHLAWLAATAGVCVALALMNRFGLRPMAVYLAGGVVLWVCVHEVGVHPTMAGVLLAFLVPGGGPAHALEKRLGGWVIWLVLPLFGLANGGLVLNDLRPADPVVWAVGLALVMGKPVGVFGATYAAVRLGAARLPIDIGWRHVLGAAALCGIGFTMSLFIGALAFTEPAMHEAAKLGIFGGSIVSALLGMLILARRDRSIG
jgi:NhaA family Na+:H+ antiporter